MIRVSEPVRQVWRFCHARFVLIIGLGLSVALMGVAAGYIARLLHGHRWIAYAGLLVILYVAVDMIWRGTRDVLPLIAQS